MHNNSTKDYILELNTAYDPEQFYYLYEKYNNDFSMYITNTNEPLGLEWYTGDDLLNEPIVKYWAEYFEIFRKDTNNKSSSRAPGIHLLRTNLNGKPNGVNPHVDLARSSGIVIPITFPQTIQWYEDDKLTLDYTYSGITIINVGRHLHGVRHSMEPRWQLQFDIFHSWEQTTILAETF